MTMRILTPGQDFRLKRNEAIRNEYARLIAREGQSRTEVVKFLMKKYKILSMSTIYTIIREGGEA